MRVIDCSVYIICFNEEKHIPRLLKNIENFAEVILVDSGSTDKTLEIAKTFSNVHIHNHPWQGFAKQKSFALSLCTKEWVLNLDADEEINQTFKDEIVRIISEKQTSNGFRTPLCEVFIGKPFHPLTKHNKKLRFFKKSQGHYDTQRLVHESIVIKGQVEDIKGLIIHHGLDSISKLVEKNNVYSSLAAEYKLSQNKKPKFLRLLLLPMFNFIKMYFLKRYFLNGWQGFIHAQVVAFYVFMKEAKLFELYYKKRDALKINHD